MSESFLSVISREPVMLAEGAVIERLRRDSEVILDSNILHAGMIYNAKGKNALEKIFRSYLEIACSFKLPMILFTPTWRANPERLRLAGLHDSVKVNADNVRFMEGLRKEYSKPSRGLFIGGLTGCRGDSYHPADALSSKEARSFHRPQLAALSAAGVDFLMAATLPSLTEALGIAAAMAETGTPFLLSFVMRPDGTLLDGTPLDEAIRQIDTDIRPAPLAYMINCVNPAVFAEALDHLGRRAHHVLDRVWGLQGNTSTKSPEELENAEELQSENPEDFAEAMTAVHRQFGIKILGGCCGTDDHHIRCIAERVVGSVLSPFS